MKKLLMLFICLSAFACQKESSNSLEYTTWSGYNNGVYRMLHFQDDNNCTDYLYISPAPPGYVAYEMTYVHTGNNVKLIEATGTHATGVINGNTLTMDYGHVDSDVWILTKQ